MNEPVIDKIELQRLISSARSRAAKMGPLSGMWDVIFDAEAYLNGRPMIVDISIVIEYLRKDDRRDGLDQKNS